MADPRVFISYARSDGEAFATRLRTRLEKSHPEITLWQDRARMEGGVGWWNQITEALDKVRFMVLVMTPAALASPIVHKEWRYARQQGVCIYPVKGVPDQQLDFRAMPKWMSKVHFYDLEKEWETFVDHLNGDCRAPRVPFEAPDLPASFVERPREFDQLRALLLAAERTDPVAITTALQGAGGFGKTTLAAALCHDEVVITAFDDGIFWVTLGENPKVLNSLAKLYTSLTREDPGFYDIEQAAQRLAERLEDRNALLVIDDVWNETHLAPFLRGGKGCARLITTRQRTIAVRARGWVVTVDEMANDEAIQMLTAKLDATPLDRVPFHALAQRLGGWPLMIDLIGSALRDRIALGGSVAEALNYVNLGLDEEGTSAFRRDDADERHQSIARAMEVSLGLLSAEARQHYLELSIFDENTDVPLSALQRVWELKPFRTTELAQRLGNLSLLRYDVDAGTIRLHNVIRSYLIEQLRDPAMVHGRLVDAWGDPHRLPDAFAWRWLAYHLIGAGLLERLRALLLDFTWLRKKLEATDVNDLVADFEHLPDDPDLRLVQGAIRLSAHVLAKDKAQLGSQFHGRLLSMGSFDIRWLLLRIVSVTTGHWLRALTPCLIPPGGELLRTLEGHGGAVLAVAVTPDGRRAVSASEDRTLRIWDLDSGQALRILEGHGDRVRAVAVTPDGRRAISSSSDGTLKLWELDSGQALRTLVGHRGVVNAVAVTPDGRRAISSSDDRTLRLWDLDSGQELRTLVGHGSSILAVAVTPDGRRAISATENGLMKLWDLDSGQALRTLKWHGGKIFGVAVLPDGHRALSASGDRTLKVWDLDSGQALRTLEGHVDMVCAVVVLSDGHRALSASCDGTLKLWDLDQGQALRTLEGHGNWVLAVAVTPDGRRAISSSSDGTLKLWDLDQGQALRTPEGHVGGVNTVVVLPDGRRALSASSDGTLKVWDLDQGQVLRTLEGHVGGVNTAVVLSDGRRALSASGDGTLKVWDLNNGQALRTLEGHTHRVFDVAVTPDGRRALSASGDGTLRLWDLDSGQALRTLEGHGSWVTAVAVLPDGRRAISGSNDHTLRLWDLDGGQALRTLGGLGYVRAVAVTSDGRRAVCASTDNTLRLWDLDSGQALHTLKGHGYGVNAVAVLADGRRALSASNDGTLKVWDLDGGQAVRTLEGHIGNVLAVVVLPDGRRALSASADKTLKLWDLDSGALLASFHGEAAFCSCAVIPDRSMFLGGDGGGQVYFLRLEGA